MPPLHDGIWLHYATKGTDCLVSLPSVVKPWHILHHYGGGTAFVHMAARIHCDCGLAQQLEKQGIEWKRLLSSLFLHLLQ